MQGTVGIRTYSECRCCPVIAAASEVEPLLKIRSDLSCTQNKIFQWVFFIAGPTKLSIQYELSFCTFILYNQSRQTLFEMQFYSYINVESNNRKQDIVKSTPATKPLVFLFFSFQCLINIKNTRIFSPKRQRYRGYKNPPPKSTSYQPGSRQQADKSLEHWKYAVPTLVVIVSVFSCLGVCFVAIFGKRESWKWWEISVVVRFTLYHTMSSFCVLWKAFCSWTIASRDTVQGNDRKEKKKIEKSIDFKSGYWCKLSLVLINCR